jgi:hypothetical protein
MNQSGRGLSTRPERAVDREKATLRGNLQSVCAKSRTAIGLRRRLVVQLDGPTPCPATSQVTCLTEAAATMLSLIRHSETHHVFAAL